MKKIVVIIIVLVLLILLFSIDLVESNKRRSYYDSRLTSDQPSQLIEGENVESGEDEERLKKELEEKLPTNALWDMDLAFLRYENQKQNIVYSSSSIKDALKFIEKKLYYNNHENQIYGLIGDYISENASKDDFIIIPSLSSPINDMDDFNKDTSVYRNNFCIEWEKVENSYLDYIKGGFSTYGNYGFALFQWKSSFINEDLDRNQIIMKFPNENLPAVYKPYGIDKMRFANDKDKIRSSVVVNAVINNYDLFNDFGEEGVRKTLEEAFFQQLEDPKQRDLYQKSFPNTSPEEWIKVFEDDYLKVIADNYHKCASSTDFLCYSDDDYLVFGKGIGYVYQYIGIIPKNESLEDFIESTNIKKINELISKLKTIESKNFKDGVATIIDGQLPIFKIQYSLNLTEDLKQLGITDIFDPSKHVIRRYFDNYNTFFEDTRSIRDVVFSQNGIKAAGFTVFAEGSGDSDESKIKDFDFCEKDINPCRAIQPNNKTKKVSGQEEFEFNYIFEVPTETIDLTFNKPFLFFVFNKKDDEVELAGAVYEPMLWKDGNYHY
jgi:hypothetical protein